MPHNEVGARKNAVLADDVFRFADEFGPAKVIYVFEPSAGLKAVLVIDNVARGPSIGGVRMAPDVSADECFRLARAMTLKNAAAGIPHGGGKSVIFADPRCPPAAKETLVRAFACAIRDLVDYIPGPDMGTDERCMAWMRDEIGRAVGLPEALSGIPLDLIGITGFGAIVAAEVAQEFCEVRLEKARIAVQGFGSVGRNAARFLVEKGAVLVAVADSKGTAHDPKGLDLARLIEIKEEGSSVVNYPGGEILKRDAIVGIDCDIWIPAARPDVIHADNVERLKARLVIEGANIPITEEAEQRLFERGVLVVPDFIANAGGVICGAVEYRGGTQADAFRIVEEKIRTNTRLVLEEAAKAATPPRQAAVALATRRVRTAMALRRWS